MTDVWWPTQTCPLCLAASSSWLTVHGLPPAAPPWGPWRGPSPGPGSARRPVTRTWPPAPAVSPGNVSPVSRLICTSLIWVLIMEIESHGDTRHWAVLSQCIYCKREAVKVLSLNSNCSDLAGVWQSPTGRGRWVCSCVASSVPVWVLKLDPRALTTSHTGPPVPACPREAANTRHSQHQKYQTQGGQVTLGSLSWRSSWGQSWPRLSLASQFWNNYFFLFAGHPAAPECPRAPSLYLGQLGVCRVSRVRGPK